MKKLGIVFLSVVMLFAFAATAFAFTDTANLGSDSQKAIDKLTNLKIIEGYEDGSFQPAAKITRGEFAKIAVLTGKEKGYSQTVAATPAYTDVKSGDWFYQWVTDASKQGMMKGNGNSLFAPNANVTQEEAVTVMVRLLGYQDADLTGSWPSNYMNKAKELGLIADATVKNTPATRETVAVIAAKTLDTAAKDKAPVVTTGLNYGVIEAVSGDTYTIYDLSKGTVTYQADSKTEMDSGKSALGKGALVQYQADSNKKLTKLTREGITTNKTMSADIKNGNITLNGKQYSIAKNVRAYQMTGDAGSTVSYQLTYDELLRNNYVGAVKSSAFSMDIQYALVDGKVACLIFGDYSSMKNLRFGFIDEYGYQASGFDNAVRFFGDPVDYELSAADLVKIIGEDSESHLYAYTVQGNSKVRSLTLVDRSQEIKGTIVSIDDDIITIKDGAKEKQLVITEDTTVLKVNYQKGKEKIVNDVEVDYELQEDDEIVARFDASDTATTDAAYILMWEEI